MSLEQKFEASEKARKEMERKKQFALTGKEALMRVETLVADMLEGKALERMQNVLRLSELVIEARDQLNVFNVNFEKLEETREENTLLLRHMDSTLGTMARNLTDFISRMDAQMQLEKETLSKLNQYVTNWL